MTVVIIDYGSGNLRSVAKAFEYAAGDSATKIIVSNNPQDLLSASRIVLPGVGAFADCMQGLKALDGMIETLNEQVIGNKKPFLGICVGMQMLFETGYEHGTHAGLGWIKGDVVKLQSQDLKIPHMGWNELNITKSDHPLLKGIENGGHAYFVHSYHAICKNEEDIIATTDYGLPINAIVGKDNILGTQFHPEKSQEVGLKLIANFLRFC